MWLAKKISTLIVKFMSSYLVGVIDILGELMLMLNLKYSQLKKIKYFNLKPSY